MQGTQCDYCRKFSPYAYTSPNMFGACTQTMPSGWVILQEERPQQMMSGLLDVISGSTAPEPRQPNVFCSRECARDYLRAATLIDGPVAR